MATKVIKVLRKESAGSRDVIDLMYDDQTHEFILRYWQWDQLRESIVLEGVEFVAMLKAGMVHYKRIQDDDEDFSPITDTLQ